MKNNKGFSLVELIVVIAIMAILAAVAVLGISMYIPKAQQAGDEQTINDVMDAMTLYYYSNPNEFTGGYVVLGLKGSDKTTADTAFGEEAMKAAFGDDWKNKVFLQYEEWNSEYTDSSFSGNEAALMGKVEGLTDVLSDTIQNYPTLVGENFESFMSSELGFSEEDITEKPNKVADAAVLYVANGTQNVNKADFVNVVSNSANADSPMDLVNDLQPLYGGSTVMTAAATYAMLTGYAEYLGKGDQVQDLNMQNVDPTKPEEVFNAVYGPFADLFPEDAEDPMADWKKYCEEQAGKDAAAFVDVMGTVSNSKNQIVDNLGTDDCFSSDELKKLYNAYSAGGVIIIAEVQEDGTFVVYSTGKAE